MTLNKKMNGADRKQSIIEAARSLFADKGFHGTTVKDIAAAAGISEALLYKHFHGKESMYKEISSYVGNLSDITEDELDLLEPGAEALARIVYLSVRLILFEVPGMEKDQYWHERLLFRSLLGDTTFARAHFKNIRAFAEDRYSVCINEALKTGDIKDTKIQSINLMWLSHHLTMALNLCHLSGDPAFEYEGTKEELAFQTASFILRGIGMTEEALSRYVRPDSLEAFFIHIYK